MAQKSLKVTVSLVEFNTKQLLKTMLKFLVTSPYQIEIWVVDNNSSDGSAQMVEQEFPQVKLIKNQNNVGFAAAHNQVLKIASTPYVMLLNPDTSLSKEAIAEMVKFMEDHPACGIASCRIITPAGKLESNGGDLPLGLALISWLFNLEVFGNLPNFHRRERSYYESAREVGWVGGTLMMIRSSILSKIGLINEDYFMYFEDVELCFKARRAGFKVMINPQVQAEHIGGASSQDPKFRQWGGEFKGLLYFYKRQFGQLTAVMIRMLIYSAIVLRLVALTVLGKFSFAKTYVKILVTI